jgi:hypothetical protein
MATKEQEILYLHKISSEIPQEYGYLVDLFKEVVPIMEGAIKDDFCTIGYGSLMDSKLELIKERDDMRKQAFMAGLDVRRIQREIESLNDQVKGLELRKSSLKHNIMETFRSMMERVREY